MGQIKMASLLKVKKNRLHVSKRTCDNRFLLLLIITFSFVLILRNFNLLYFSDDNRSISPSSFIESMVGSQIFFAQKSDNSSRPKDKDAYLIDTEGCRIPKLNSYDEIVQMIMNRKYLFNPCPKQDKALLKSNGTHVWITKENVKHHHHFTNHNSQSTLNLSLLSCCYQTFYRAKRVFRGISNMDQLLIFDNCTFFVDIIDINPAHEFVVITCYYNETKVYNKLLVNVPKKNLMLREGLNPQSDNNIEYNVLVLGVDSVSRLNFHRTMPKTCELLKSLGAVELLGYNKVGDDTFSNAVPLLMGLRHTALQAICTPYKNVSFDSCPLVWKWYKQAGYYTAFAEDTARHGIFHYLKGGFNESPTDYYLHPFNILSEILGNNYNAKYKRKLCLQGRFMYEVLLDYIKKLTKTLANSKLFGFFWDINLSHDGLNNAKAIDGGYKNFFTSLYESGYLENTAVIFLSDHGIRFGDIFKAPERGRLESKLPFLYVLLPSSFREKYSRAYNLLRQNSKRLTTPYDVHKTLLDLSNLTNIENDAIIYRSKQYYINETGISLFLPIPGNRTCKMADIDDTWCSCHKASQISVHAIEVQSASYDLIQYINKLLFGYYQCATLTVSRIIYAMKVTASHWNETRLLVLVQVDPGEGKFEGFMQKVGNTWKPVGTVSRLNRYGHQSRCIDLYELKLYCYCV